MGDVTKIEWTDATWNPIAGCSPVSPGCTHCYAATMARRLEAMGQAKYQWLAERRGSVDVFTGQVVFDERHLFDPLKWKRSRRIFVNSMSDLFHESVPLAWIDQIFGVMGLAPQHTFQVLTKRPRRMCVYCESKPWFAKTVTVGFEQTGRLLSEGTITHSILPNVWLGTSIENQATADVRIPDLLDTPAAVRFLSCEPLLGPIDLDCLREVGGLIDWIIVGGESGPKARPMHPDWVRSIRDQCVAAGVPFFFKQWGEFLHAPLAISTASAASDGRGPEWKDFRIDLAGRDVTFAPGLWDYDDAIVWRVGKKRAGRELDGRTWDEYPKAGARLEA